MEEKVQSVLKLIEEEGDSFAKRAEMYYKNRPELINFVQESFRSYRALAERYDHISTELQNANTTIASVFPEQVQFAMDEEDEFNSPRNAKKLPQMSKLNVPKAPKGPVKELKNMLATATRKFQPKSSKKTTKTSSSSTTGPKSGLSKPEALEKVDKLQKEILCLQTEKEFLKSSYEHGVAKYREIDKQINEMQEEVCELQDEFGAGLVIEDDEARSLMATAALKSCQDTLANLQEKQEKTAQEAIVERERIQITREKLESLKDEFLADEEKSSSKDKAPVRPREESKRVEQELESNAAQHKQELEMLREKIKAHFEAGAGASLSVTEMAEKIDELVNKVISLETAVSSQTALIQRLRTETDELQTQIQTLEDDKASLVSGSNNLTNQLKEMEEKLRGIQDLDQSVEEQNNNLQTHFTEACCNLDHLSEKLSSVKPDEELEVVPDSSAKQKKSEKKSKKSKKESKADSKKLEKSKQEKEPEITGSSQEESEGREAAAVVSSGVKEVENSKQDQELEITGSTTTEKAPVKSQEESGGGEAATPNISSCVQEVEDSKQDKETEIAGSSQAEKAPVKSEEESEGREVPKKVENSKPDEELKAIDSLQKQDGPEKGEQAQTHGEGAEKAKDVKAEVKEDTKEGEVSTSASNQGEDGRKKVLDRRTKQTLESLPENALDNLREETPDIPREKALESDAEKSEESKLSSSKEEDSTSLDVETQETEQEDEPNWRVLYTKGMEDREKTLLAEYTTSLRNFKEVKRKLDEVEKKSQEGLFETTLHIRELKTANAMKDEENRLLRQKLSLLQTMLEGNKDTGELKNELLQTSSLLDDQNRRQKGEEEDEDEDDFKFVLDSQNHETSEIEEKFRADIDALLEENLDFWLRFSTSFHQIQKFETEIQDLKAEVTKIEKAKKSEGSNSRKSSLKSDARSIYKHLREIQTELTVWMEQGALLKEELQCRFSSLCSIQEEITKALKDSAEDEDFKFTSFQAAKFQGEVLNMKQENNKVADELQAGLDHITGLQLQVEKSLTNLNDEFGFAGSKSNVQLQHSGSRSRVPLRSFIFGVKPKKQKQSIFSCVSPALNRKYHIIKQGVQI